MEKNQKTNLLKIYGTFNEINESTFNKLGFEFGTPTISDEVTIYYKIREGIKIRIDSNGLFLFKQKKKKKRIFEESIFLKIGLDEVKSFLKLLSIIGLKKAIILNSTVFKYSIVNRELVLRFDKKEGNTWRISSKIPLKEVEKEEKILKKRFKNFGFDILKKLPKSSDEKLESIFLNNNLNQKISLVVQKYLGRTVQLKGLSISESLQLISNDYSEYEEVFNRFTKKQLLSKFPLKYPHDFFLKTSIIIPTYNNYEKIRLCLKSIANQNLTKSQFSTVEVIVVDDGSAIKDSESLYDKFKEIIEDKGMVFNYIRSHRNNGRAVTRNLGLQSAEGDIILFLDADVIIDQHFILETVVRHQYLDKIILVSFKENIDINNNDALNKSGYQIRKVNWKDDFRVKKRINKGWVGYYPGKIGETIKCLSQSNFFKNFGYGKLIGPFNLQSMIVTNNLSVKRKELDKIRGFRKEFKKWGYEDACLGAELICNSNYLIPIISTGIFHLENVHLFEKNKKMKDISANFNLYQNILNQRG